jgi:hypothetical protein
MTESREGRGFNCPWTDRPCAVTACKYTASDVCVEERLDYFRKGEKASRLREVLPSTKENPKRKRRIRRPFNFQFDCVSTQIFLDGNHIYLDDDRDRPVGYISSTADGRAKGEMTSPGGYTAGLIADNKAAVFDQFQQWANDGMPGDSPLVRNGPKAEGRGR